MTDEQHLSEDGQRRRQQILQLAQGEARRRRRRRTVGRGGGVALVGLLAGVSILSVLHRRSSPILAPMPIARVNPTTEPSLVAIEYIQTDPTITERLTIKPQPPRWTSIDDHQLLDELAAAGQPAGIVCMNGKTILMMR